MYSIYAGNTLIFDDTSPALEHQLINPKLQLSAGAAGSLTITVPKTNAGYSDSVIKRLTTTIKVKRDGTEIWRGRVLTESKDLWNNRVLFCEGCLAFLNDSIQSSSTAVTGQVPAYISALLTNHNNKVASNRQISLGTVSVEDPAGSISRYLNGETTLALLQKLVNELGGVLRTRFSGETILLDYLKEYPSSGSYALSMGTLEAGGIRYNTGATYSSTTIYRNPANIPLGNYPSGSKLKYSRIHTTATSANTVHGIAFYNSEGTYISGVKSGTGASATHYEDYETTIPNGAAYVRLSLLNPANYSGAFANVKWEGGAAAQSIDLEENLLDFTRDWDNTDFCSVVLPRGARQDSEDSNKQVYLDISGATAPNGYTRIDTTDAVYLSKNDLFNPEYPSAGFGRIEKVVDFSDIGSGLDPTSGTYATDLATAKGQLIGAAADYLANQQYDGMTLELKAVDMHMVDPATAAWNLLDKVNVYATPYFTGGKTFAITGMQIPLDAPEKTKYTLGPEAVPKKRRVLSLTKQQQQAQAELADSVESARSAGQDYTDGEVVIVKHWVDNDSGVFTEISNARGAEASLSVRLTGIDADVSTADGHAAQAQVTANGILEKVSYVDDNDVRHWTVANLKADGFYIYDSGSSATRTLITGSMIDVDTIFVDHLYGGTIAFYDTDKETVLGYLYITQSGNDKYIDFSGFYGVIFASNTYVSFADPSDIYFTQRGKTLDELLQDASDGAY